MDNKDWRQTPPSEDIDWHELQKAAPTTHLVPDDDKRRAPEPTDPIPQFSAPTQHLIPDQPDDKAPTKDK